VSFAPAYYLAANRPFFPPALVSEAALARLEPIATLLPPAATIAVECRLAAGADTVDFIPQFGRSAGAALARSDPAGAAWSAVRAFCAHWLAPDWPPGESIHAIWLEFDVIGGDAGPPPPSLFVGFAGAAKTAGYGPPIEATVALLRPGLPLEPFGRAVDACFAALPAGAELFSLGLMLGRGDAPARLAIGHLPPDRLLDFLEQIGWPGPPALAGEWANRLAPLVDDFGLALDLDGQLLPRLGLECYLLEANPKKEKRWAELLALLVGSGFSAPDRAAGLLGWPGRHFHGLAPAEIAALRANAPSLPPRLVNLLTRRVSHLKIVLEPGRAPEAKAYLELSHAWFPFGSAIEAGRLEQE
jgi:hypothetical protein